MLRCDNSRVPIRITPPQSSLRGVPKARRSNLQDLRCIGEPQKRDCFGSSRPRNDSSRWAAFLITSLQGTHSSPNCHCEEPAFWATRQSPLPRVIGDVKERLPRTLGVLAMTTPQTPHILLSVIARSPHFGRRGNLRCPMRIGNTKSGIVSGRKDKPLAMTKKRRPCKNRIRKHSNLILSLFKKYLTKDKKLFTIQIWEK